MKEGNANQVVNLSQRQLSDTESNVLALGMSFAAAPNKIHVPIEEFIQTIEPSIHKLDKQKGGDVRIQIHEVLKNSKTSQI